MLRTCKKNMCLEKIRCPLVRAPGGGAGAAPARDVRVKIKPRGKNSNIKSENPRGGPPGDRELPGRRDARCE